MACVTCSIRELNGIARMSELLRVENLSVSFESPGGRLQVLNDVSFCLERGEVIGLVGESGSGKSVTAFAIMQLLGRLGRIDAGQIHLEGQDLTRLTARQMERIRGKDLSMIFQEPMSSLNPVYTIGMQIMEPIMKHQGAGRRDARRTVVGLLESVGIAAATTRLEEYPHQLSGGMRQRVMIAMALACQPGLLIADEPTTALDVTIQAQILELLRTLQAESELAMLLITHDFGVVAELAQRVIVMYAGEIVEMAAANDLMHNPLHPYTRELLRSIPRLRERSDVLPTIPGSAPAPGRIPGGCRFHDRCALATNRCVSEKQPLRRVTSGRRVRCWMAAE